MNRILNLFRSSPNLQPTLELKFNKIYGLNFDTIQNDARIIVNVPEIKECSVIYKHDGSLFYINIQNAKLSAELKDRFPAGSDINLNDMKCSKHEDINEEIIRRVVFNIKYIAQVILKTASKCTNCVYCLASTCTNDSIPHINIASFETRNLTLDDHLNEITYHHPHLSFKELSDIVAEIRIAQNNRNLENLNETKVLIRRKHNLPVAIALAIQHMENYRINLATIEEENFRVRDVQILAIVIATMKGKQTFLEVKTGEGKTIIIALIAAVKLLLGDTECVDIITCNEILAKHNHDDMKPFFASLRISSACNNPTDNDDIYKQQVVYGALHNFQYDQLRHAIGDHGRGDRTFALCIIDEVDLLTIDNSKHLAKIAAPFPGIEELQPVYVQVFHQKDTKEEVNLSKVPKYLRELCKHMYPEWQEACKHIKQNHYMKDHYYTLVTKDTRELEGEHDIPPEQYPDDQKEIAPINVHSGEIMHRATFNNGIQQFLEIYNVCSVTGETFNSICISNHGYLKRYDQLCGFTGTLGTVENCGEMEQSLLIQMFGQISFYRIPRYCDSKFKPKQTVAVKDGEFEIIRIARKLGNQVKIYADNRNFRMNKLLEIAKPYPEFEQDQIQILELDNYKPPLDSAITKIEIADNYIEPTKNSHVEFKNIQHSPFILDIFRDNSCIVYHDSEMCWKLNIIDHLISINDGEAISESNKQHFKYHLNDILKKYKQITIYTKIEIDLELDPERITIIKELGTPDRRYTLENDEAFVYPLLRGAKLDKCRSGDLSTLDIFNDIVMLQSPKSTIMFIFGKYKKHFQIIDAHVQNILDQKRAVLVVFENLMSLKRYKQVTEHKEIKIYDGKRSIDMIDCKNVILTTNIGGRGADFRISDELKQNKGLHVIITFMPPNERVQWQAFGRTARNGSPGSGEIIVDAHDWPASSDIDKDITQQRDAQYKSKLKKIANNMDNVQKQLDLITAFSDMRRKLSEEHPNSDEYDFVLDDLTELWAVWLKMNLEKNTKFKDFESDALNLIEKKRFYNPCHWIRGAKYYLCYNNIDEAKRLLYATFDQEVYGVAIVQEYILFAQLAIAKGEMLSEARDALLKEPFLLYSERQKLLKIIEEMTPNSPPTPQIRKEIMRYVQHNLTNSYWTKARIVFSLVLIPLKKIVQTVFAMLAVQCLQTLWSRILSKPPAIVSDSNVVNNVMNKIVTIFSENSTKLDNCLESELEKYGNDFISTRQAFQGLEKEMESIIISECTTTNFGIPPETLYEILKDEFEKFRIHEKNIDDMKIEFRNLCRRINGRINQQMCTDYTTVVDPRIVMDLFNDYIQHWMKQAFTSLVFKQQRQHQHQHQSHHRIQKNL